MTALLAKFWPLLASAFTVVCMFVYGAFVHQSAKTAKAVAVDANDKADAATREAAAARADAESAQKATAAVQSASTDRQAIDADVAALAKTPGAAQAALKAEGFTE